MKTPISILSITVLAFAGAIAQTPVGDKPALDQSIVGKWKVKSDKADVWTFAEPNTMTSSSGAKATWKRLDAGYEVSWSAATVASVTISADGLSLRAVGTGGKAIEADRVVAPPDPIIGKWMIDGSDFTFRSDGTCSAIDRRVRDRGPDLHGKWTLASSSERKYDIQFGGGRRIGVLTLLPSGKEGKYKDNTGFKTDIRRLESE